MSLRHPWPGVGTLALALGLCFALPAYLSYKPTPAPGRDRDNDRWRAALADYPERYAGMDRKNVREIQTLELQYRDLMDALTVVDGMGGDHGKFHRTKPDRERELWTLLERLPRYPAAPRMILAALDDVYLGFHGNGWWGSWWHWPYLDCVKANAIADRLSRDFPEMDEEALWTKIYCYRIAGWSERAEWQGRDPQDLWRSDVRRARALASELLKKYPAGKYAARVTALLALEDLYLVLPHYPVMGRTPGGLGGRSHTERSYTGPEFQIDRRP